MAFGFATPAHMVEAVHQALRDGENGYGPSVGLLPAREAVAAENTSRGWAIDADRVILTSGSSEGIDFVLTALADPGDEVLVPLPTYPLYTAILHKIGAREVYYRTDPSNGWQPDPDEIRASHHAANEGARRERPEQSDRRGVLDSPSGASCSRLPIDTTCR